MGFKSGQMLIDKLRGKNQNFLNETQDGYLKEIYWANVFRDSIQNSVWLKNKSFSPGRWAINYIGLYVFYRVLNDFKPKNILECGLGQSSKMTIQYAKHFNSKLNIFEHNIPWIEFFEKGFENISQYIKRSELEKVNILGKESLTYKNFEQQINNEKFDFIFIDGPYGSDNYARSQMINLINNLEKSFVIIMDDYERKGEQETVELFEEKLKLAGIKYLKQVYSSDKSLCLICSKDLEYLTSL